MSRSPSTVTPTAVQTGRGAWQLGRPGRACYGLIEVDVAVNDVRLDRVGRGIDMSNVVCSGRRVRCVVALFRLRGIIAVADHDVQHAEMRGSDKQWVLRS